MQNTSKKIVLVAVLVLVIGGIWYLETIKDETSEPVVDVSKEVTADDQSAGDRIAKKQDKYSTAKEITSPDHFINTEPFELADLIGKKVILVDFWTYSCINCQRTLPYLTQWHEKYADKGLVIVGVHTPEFEFEKKLENVQDAVEQFGVKYPVVMDNDFSTWKAYKNRFWPRKYLIDIDGFVVYDHIGEGGYAETEKKIQELLGERMEVLGEEGDVNMDLVEEKAGAVGVDSPEVYFGSARNKLLANGLAGVTGDQIFKAPDKIEKNKLYLGDKWNFSSEFAESKTDEAKVIFKYEAGKVFFVGSADQDVKVKILWDGEAVGDEAGADVDEDGYVTVNKERLYEIINDPAGPGEHTLEMIVDGPGLKMFTFTFG